MEPSANQYEQERRQKMQKLRDMGIDPFGGRVEGIATLAAIRQLHKPEFGQDGGPVVKAAGRSVFNRDMGKLCFARLRDETGELQIALDKKRLSEADWNVVKLLDLGDQIVIEGPLGQTKTGEVTVWAKGLTMAAKSLLPPPEKWQGLTDVEQRYRQRYVDLFTNPDVMKLLRLRSTIVAEIRQYMTDRGYLEVETPMMQPIPGGAAARPFITHHRALDIDLYLRIAPELYLKRLLVGGFSKVFELNRNFRNEGISPRHNPEFTMLEAYEAYGSWETMADLVEGMICHLAEKLFGGLKIYHRDRVGMEAAQAYIRQPNDLLMEQICQGRLNLIDAHRAFSPATPSENYAQQTGSEGYEIGQDGFDKLITEYKGILNGKPPEQQWAILAEKFVVKVIDLSRPWRRLSMAKLVEKRTGWKFDGRRSQEAAPEFVAAISGDTDDVTRMPAYSQAICAGAPDREAIMDKTLLHLYPMGSDPAFLASTPAEQLVQVYEKGIERELINPTFVTQVPSVIIPLARKNKSDPFFADVYELAINGQEISPGYTELNDPDVQAENFKHQVGDKDEQQKTDDDFLNALRYGMPPAGGMGLGIDRLVMMLTGAESIRDVILFPLMKPQGA